MRLLLIVPLSFPASHLVSLKLASAAQNLPNFGLEGFQLDMNFSHSLCVEKHLVRPLVPASKLRIVYFCPYSGREKKSCNRAGVGKRGENVNLSALELQQMEEIYILYTQRRRSLLSEK